MQKAKIQFKIQNLRKEYPKFIYQDYSYRIFKNNLEIFFDFKIPPDIEFQPKITIENVADENRVLVKRLDNLVFHLGLMEIPSYWKATCSPEILIKTDTLNKEQINWWKDLIMNGMGQFFYENKIDFTKPNFLTIKNPSNNQKTNLPRINLGLGEKGILVPVGGGKDSLVTLELLKKVGKDNIQCFFLNPTVAAKQIMQISGCRNPIIARRKIDEKLLELNRRGFLNGHTPFSAYLAFLSALVAAISDKKRVALSNERSSNQGNIKYLGKTVNHQWSKSFEFEKKFRKYSKKYLVKDVEYFSFLRPLYEIQIAKLFSKFSKYFSIFLSCNEAYKTASGTKKPTKKWCSQCSKCLFAFVILYPFVPEIKLIKIFGKNLFGDKTLLPIMQQLIGERGFKPFECVGTKKESLVAFHLSWKKKSGERVSRNLPGLLKYFEEKILPKYPNLEKESKKLINSWNKENNLPKEFKKILKNRAPQR